MILDITRPMSPKTEPWPGDVAFTPELTFGHGQGGSITNVCAIRTSTHLGTHVDAPWHFLPEGATVERLPLDAFLGPARVVDALEAQRVIEPTERVLRQLDGAERVLFRTRERLDPYRFDPGFAGIASGLAEEMARRRLRLSGTDAPSTDVYQAPGLPSHHLLARAGCQLLEGLDLTQAAPGDYDLVALPLRLEGLDGSPVRAVLRR